jgi:hypothetical protein
VKKIMSRGRKKAEVKVLAVKAEAVKAEAVKAEAVKAEETKLEEKEFENVLSVMPWEKISLKDCTREELLTVILPRFAMDKDKVPSILNAAQNALSLEEKVSLQAFSMSRREKMELRKIETIASLDKEIEPILSVKADTFVDLFKEFGFTADGKEKKSFSLSKNYGHRVGKEHYKIAWSVALTKEDVPLTEKELLELQYQKAEAEKEAAWEKMRLLMVGHEMKEQAADSSFASQFRMTEEDKVNSAKTSFSK